MKRDIRFIEYSRGSDKGDFKFDWNSSTTDVRGREKLIQDIVKRILTAKGSNVFDPEYGENFYNLFGSFDPSKEQDVKESFPVLLKTMEDDIISEQSLNDTLTSSEKLLSLKLGEVKMDETSGSWVIKIQIKTEDLVNSFFTID